MNFWTFLIIATRNEIFKCQWTCILTSIIQFTWNDVKIFNFWIDFYFTKTIHDIRWKFPIYIFYILPNILKTTLRKHLANTNTGLFLNLTVRFNLVSITAACNLICCIFSIFKVKGARYGFPIINVTLILSFLIKRK